MNKKLLLLLLLSIQTALYSFNKEKSTTGPSIALIMMQTPANTNSNLAHYTLFVKNNGDETLTNIHVERLSNDTSSLMIFNQLPYPQTSITSLAPGQEDSFTFYADVSVSPYDCNLSNQTIVYATTQSNQQISDLSSNSNYYDDIPTTPHVEYLFSFNQDGIYQDLNGNNIVDVGDAINYTYTLLDGPSNIPFNLIDNNALINNPNGVPPYFTTTGIHYLTATEVSDGYVYNYPSINTNISCFNIMVSSNFIDPTPCNNCPCVGNGCYGVIITKLTNLLANTISGNVKFNTNNNNCSTGSNFKNRRITANNGVNSYSSFSGNSGNYNIYIPNTGTYNVSALTNLNSNFSSSPTSSTIISSGQNNTYNANFCISSATNYSDLEVSLIPITNARPGFTANYRLYYTNLGSTSLSGSIHLTFDNGKLNLANTIPAPTSNTANSITWNYTNLLPFENRSIALTFSVFTPPTVNDGDILTFIATGNPTLGDANTANNSFQMNQVVVNAFDPNDKTVVEGAYISQSQVGNYLHYITRFQNTGSATATTVVLKETLDDDLDWSTFEPIESSHNYTIQIKDNNQLTCTFSNINLASSASNEPASHGWFSYKIKPKSTFTYGNIASSDSKIYFDYNLPISTNIVTTQITALNTTSFVNEKFQIIPNPVQDSFSITGNFIDSYTYQIHDCHGKLLADDILQKDQKVNISHFANGLYLVTIKSSDQSNTYKIIKE